MKKPRTKKTRKIKPQSAGVTQILKNLQEALVGASKNLNALKPRLSAQGLVRTSGRRAKSDLPKPYYGFDLDKSKKKTVSTQTSSDMATQT